MSWDHCRTIEVALRVCREISSVDFFEDESGWRREAALVLLLINLKDALQLLAVVGQRVAFNDDVENGDVTDLIAELRNASCHNGSALRLVNPQTMSALHFGLAVGKGRLGIVGGKVLENPYEDDVAFFYGHRRLFFGRHILRAIAEAETALKVLAQTHGYSLHF